MVSGEDDNSFWDFFDFDVAEDNEDDDEDNGEEVKRSDMQYLFINTMIGK